MKKTKSTATVGIAKAKTNVKTDAIVGGGSAGGISTGSTTANAAFRTTVGTPTTATTATTTGTTTLVGNSNTGTAGGAVSATAVATSAAAITIHHTAIKPTTKRVITTNIVTTRKPQRNDNLCVVIVPKKDDKDKHSVNSKAVVKFQSIKSPAHFALLECNTNLNMPPSHWLTNSSNGLQKTINHSTGFSSFSMADTFSECVGKVDVISNAENIKRLLKIPYLPKHIVSLMIHRVENTLLIDEFDIHKHLLRQATDDWKWLRNFIYENIINGLNDKDRALLIKNKSHAAIQTRNLISKFLYHSLTDEPPLPAEAADVKLKTATAKQSTSSFASTKTRTAAAAASSSATVVVPDTIPSKTTINNKTTKTKVKAAKVKEVKMENVNPPIKQLKNHQPSTTTTTTTTTINGENKEKPTNSVMIELTDEPLLPDVNVDENVPDPYTSAHTYNRNVVWTFEDIRMLVGTDMPIFGGGVRPCISLRLRDMTLPINVLTGIDYWLDNLMCNVPEVVMCYHLDGLVQKYEIIKTEDLPHLENSKFSAKTIRNVAQNLLAFLKQNATKAGHTYWLFKGRNDDAVKLYDLTTLCNIDDTMDIHSNNTTTTATGSSNNDERPNTQKCNGKTNRDDINQSPASHISSEDVITINNIINDPIKENGACIRDANQSIKTNALGNINGVLSTTTTTPTAASTTTTTTTPNDINTNLTNNKLANPFTVPVAMLLYKVAKNMKKSTKKITPKAAGSIRLLLENCIKLLPIERYPQIITSSYYILSDLYVPMGIDPLAPDFNDTIIDNGTTNNVSSPSSSDTTTSSTNNNNNNSNTSTSTSTSTTTNNNDYHKSNPIQSLMDDDDDHVFDLIGKSDNVDDYDDDDEVDIDDIGTFENPNYDDDDDGDDDPKSIINVRKTKENGLRIKQKINDSAITVTESRPLPPTTKHIIIQTTTTTTTTTFIKNNIIDQETRNGNISIKKISDTVNEFHLEPNWKHNHIPTPLTGKIVDRCEYALDNIIAGLRCLKYIAPVEDKSTASASSVPSQPSSSTITTTTTTDTTAITTKTTRNTTTSTITTTATVNVEDLNIIMKRGTLNGIVNSNGNGNSNGNDNVVNGGNGAGGGSSSGNCDTIDQQNQIQILEKLNDKKPSPLKRLHKHLIEYLERNPLKLTDLILTAVSPTLPPTVRTSVDAAFALWGSTQYKKSKRGRKKLTATNNNNNNNNNGNKKKGTNGNCSGVSDDDDDNNDDDENVQTSNSNISPKSLIVSSSTAAASAAAAGSASAGKSSSDIESWHLHLKVLLVEKACLTYAILVEHAYSQEHYGTALKYIVTALRCQQVITTHVSTMSSQEICLIGRAGDCYIQMTKHIDRIPEFTEQYKIRDDMDRDIYIEMLNDIDIDNDYELPSPTTHIEHMMMLSCACYESALNYANKTSRREILRRLGSARNELGVKYMHWAQDEYQKFQTLNKKAVNAIESGKDEPIYQILTKKSYDSFARGVSAFEEISDKFNLAILLCNLGRFMRYRAHVKFKGEDVNNVQFRQKFYETAFLYYNRGLDIIESRNANPELHDAIQWELSCGTYALVQCVQESTKKKEMNEAYNQKLIDVLKNALRCCDIETPNLRLPLYKFRIGSIYNHLAIIYKRKYKKENDELRKKNFLKCCRSYYEKSMQIYFDLRDVKEYLDVQINRIGLHEMLCEASLNPPNRIKHLQMSLEIFKESKQIFMKLDGAIFTLPVDATLLEFENKLQTTYRNLIKLCLSTKIATEKLPAYKQIYSLTLRQPEPALDTDKLCQHLGAILMKM